MEGLAFHHYYFQRTGDTDSAPFAVNVTMASPHLRWLDDDAIVISYPFLTQKRVNGEAITNRCCKTRIWNRSGNVWEQAHIHRS